MTEKLSAAAGNAQAAYVRLPDLIVGTQGNDTINATQKLGNNILVNGGFEDGQAANSWSNTQECCWMEDANAGEGLELWGQGSSWFVGNRGFNFMELDSNNMVDTIYQDVTTTAGQEYQLSFDAAARPGVANATKNHRSLLE